MYTSIEWFNQIFTTKTREGDGTIRRSNSIWFNHNWYNSFGKSPSGLAHKTNCHWQSHISWHCRKATQLCCHLNDIRNSENSQTYQYYNVSPIWYIQKQHFQLQNVLNFETEQKKNAHQNQSMYLLVFFVYSQH